MTKTSGSTTAVRRLRPFAIALLAAALGACAIGERIDEASKIDYKSSTKGPSLDVPPDLAAPSADGRYVVPERAARTASTYESSRAAERSAAVAPAAVLPKVEGARIERDGSQRWLVVDLPPDRVWPVVRDFWRESGLGVKTESPETGIIETDWAENRAKLPLDFIRRTIGRALDDVYSTGERDMFRTRLEKAGNATEIFISHRGMVEVYTSAAQERTVWQPRPGDPELEAEFLQRLMLKFAPAGGTQAAAAASATTERARLVDSGATQALDVREGFDRAWRRVGLALDRGGFTVEDRDRAQGLYYVRYIDPEVEGGRVAAKPGFLGRLFGTAKTRSDASQQFRIKVEGSGEQSQVTVQAPDGKPVGDVDRRTAGRILALLYEQLK
ncbi:MAG TPA: outer membrane protein assembly factor BamC [Burkholderiaceae bacterium]|nr:outer membrane protein assembly factor BamC [Burkholderiaceae bacterium]